MVVNRNEDDYEEYFSSRQMSKSDFWVTDYIEVPNDKGIRFTWNNPTPTGDSYIYVLQSGRGFITGNRFDNNVNTCKIELWGSRAFRMYSLDDTLKVGLELYNSEEGTAVKSFEYPE